MIVEQNHDLVVGEPSARVSVRSWLMLVRAPVCVLAFFGTYLGAILSGFGSFRDGDLLTLDTMFLALSMACLCGASMAFNDLRDVATDAINQPSRPIVSGALSAQAALRSSALLFLLGVALAFRLGGPASVLAASIVLLSVLYTLELKRIPWLGNTTVAVIGAAPVWAWLFLSEPADAVYLFACLSTILLFLGEEVIKTSEDVPGDLASGVNTVASMLGTSLANRWGLSVALAALSIGFLPLVTGLANLIFLVCFAICLTIMINMTARTFSQRGGSLATTRVLLYRIRFIKVVMLVGVALGLPPGSIPVP